MSWNCAALKALKGMVFLTMNGNCTGSSHDATICLVYHVLQMMSACSYLLYDLLNCFSLRLFVESASVGGASSRTRIAAVVESFRRTLKRGGPMSPCVSVAHRHCNPISKINKTLKH